MVASYLEDRSIYWNDDIGTVCANVMKTIRQFQAVTGNEQPLEPMFKKDDDREFGIRLLHQSLLHADKYRKDIEKYLINWDTNRIARMDMILMQMAVAEMNSFPSIPAAVSLNEYIDLAKYYSTPKSGQFLNAILDAYAVEHKRK
jgi:N utilization substance protein B